MKIKQFISPVDGCKFDYFIANGILSYRMIESPLWHNYNPNNKDFECFKWAVLIALHHKEITKYKKNPGNIAAYKQWENEFDFTGITKMDKDGSGSLELEELVPLVKGIIQDMVNNM